MIPHKKETEEKNAAYNIVFKKEKFTLISKSNNKSG